MPRLPPGSTLFPYTTLFRSRELGIIAAWNLPERERRAARVESLRRNRLERQLLGLRDEQIEDRKSTRLNSSHRCSAYAVFGLKKKQSSNHGVTEQDHTPSRT